MRVLLFTLSYVVMMGWDDSDNRNEGADDEAAAPNSSTNT